MYHQTYMDEEDPLYFADSEDWRRWLKENHKNSKAVWLLYYKKHTGHPSITHAEAVDEALCYGWIDSKVKSLDNDRYIQKFTPRKKDSVWSKINKEAAIRLTKEKKMTSSGNAMVKIAKENGMWERAYSSKESQTIPYYLEVELKKDKKAWRNFSNFATSHQNLYINWVESAKTETTRDKRVKVVVANSRNNLKATFI